MIFNSDKRYFKKKLQAIHYSILDLEFKRFKTLELREGVRKEYDHLRSRLEVLGNEIQKESLLQKTKDEQIVRMSVDEFKRLEDQKVLIERDIERMITQMKQLDMEVNGSKATENMPEGYTGISNQLDGLRELSAMVKEYIAQM